MDITQAIFPLIEANDLPAVEALLDEHPGLVHARRMDSEHTRGALQHAASLGLLDLCRLLVERGAEVYPNPWNQYPPVMEAYWGKHPAVVDYFLNEIPHLAEGTNLTGVAINLAGRAGWADIVRRHLERDPLSVHQRGWIGDTPLHWPSHNRFAEIVRMLLDAGADIEADELNWLGGKPLHWASEHAPECVQVLLEAGAEVDSRNVCRGSDFEGMTALITNAAQRDDCAEVTELLLAAGADVNAVDAQGRTALMHATQRGSPRITAVLRAAGAAA